MKRSKNCVELTRSKKLCHVFRRISVILSYISCSPYKFHFIPQCFFLSNDCSFAEENYQKKLLFRRKGNVRLFTLLISKKKLWPYKIQPNPPNLILSEGEFGFITIEVSIISFAFNSDFPFDLSYSFSVWTFLMPLLKRFCLSL